MTSSRFEKPRQEAIEIIVAELRKAGGAEVPQRQIDDALAIKGVSREARKQGYETAEAQGRIVRGATRRADRERTRPQQHWLLGPNTGDEPKTETPPAEPADRTDRGKGKRSTLDYKATGGDWDKGSTGRPA